ncbi:MAG: TonB-dependent receptor [Asticcacaulis sp.]
MGATSLPEALRLAPNLEVARINGYSWSVTARGFNSPETANKLLVLIDGRSVYEPIGSGVLWEQVDVNLAEIQRIEVISGPGGTMWGANAVNGVINVITRDASAAQGLHAQATAGVVGRNASVRFGGKLGQNASFEVSASGFDDDRTPAVQAGDTLDDTFSGAQGGVSIDGSLGADSYRLKAGAYRNTITDWGHLDGYNLLGSWTHTLAGGSTVVAHASASHDDRVNPVLDERRDTVSIDAQQTIASSGRHKFIWGGEYRYWRQFYDSHVVFRFADPETTISVSSVFAQDEIALRPNLKLTLGLKAENSSYSGFDWLPSARLAWQPDDNNLVWGAVSQAVRTPNRVERELEWPGVLPPSPDFQAEKLTAYEAGWRARPADRLSLSLSAFYNVYDDLRTESYTLSPPLIFLANGAHGTTYGLEAWGKYEVRPGWRINAGFNLLHKHFKLKSGANDLTNLAVAGMDPDYQAQIRSEWTVTDKVGFDLALRRVAKIDNAPVPAYTEADIHLDWRVSQAVEFSLDGQNLLNPRHLEVWDTADSPPRYVPRSVFVTLRYGF